MVEREESLVVLLVWLFFYVMDNLSGRVFDHHVKSMELKYGVPQEGARLAACVKMVTRPKGHEVSSRGNSEQVESHAPVFLGQKKSKISGQGRDWGGGGAISHVQKVETKYFMPND